MKREKNGTKDNRLWPYMGVTFCHSKVLGSACSSSIVYNQLVAHRLTKEMIRNNIPLVRVGHRADLANGIRRHDRLTSVPAVEWVIRRVPGKVHHDAERVGVRVRVLLELRLVVPLRDRLGGSEAEVVTFVLTLVDLLRRLVDLVGEDGGVIVVVVDLGGAVARDGALVEGDGGAEVAEVKVKVSLGLGGVLGDLPLGSRKAFRFVLCLMPRFDLLVDFIGMLLLI